MQALVAGLPLSAGYAIGVVGDALWSYSGKGDSAVAVEGLPSGVEDAPVDGGMPAELLAGTR